jgi:hypothetical protein
VLALAASSAPQIYDVVHARRVFAELGFALQGIDLQFLHLVYRVGLDVGHAAEILCMAARRGSDLNARVVLRARELFGDGPFAAPVLVSRLLRPSHRIASRQFYARGADGHRHKVVVGPRVMMSPWADGECVRIAAS